jgi:hypothetical protein
MPGKKRKTLPHPTSDDAPSPRRTPEAARTAAADDPDAGRDLAVVLPTRPLGEHAAPTPEPLPARTRRHVQPLGPRVLVRIRDVPQRLESGLYLPASAVSTLPEAVLAEVVEVARTPVKTDTAIDAGRDDRDADSEDSDGDDPEITLGENVSGIPLGALVLFGRDHGIRVPWDDRLRLVEVRHILAIVDEIPEDALQ